MPETSARDRVLGVAEALFSERGFNAVTMRDIADALGMRQASLYYHAPAGKEQLFIEVLERNLNRHRAGLEGVIERAAPGLAEQLRAASSWLLSQPPVSLLRMVRSDMPSLHDDHAGRLSQLAYRSIIVPLARVFLAASERGEIRAVNPSLLAGSFLAVIDSIAYARTVPQVAMAAEAMVEEMIDVFLNGLSTSADGCPG